MYFKLRIFYLLNATNRAIKINASADSVLSKLGLPFK